MSIGPGKYDEVCTQARISADALAVALIVLGGNKGSGFSVQCVERANDKVMVELPKLLRSMADQIEADLK